VAEFAHHHHPDDSDPGGQPRGILAHQQSLKRWWSAEPDPWLLSEGVLSRWSE
jgi:hypothetical protein